LTFEQKINIVKELGKVRVWYLSFCGGEPLLESHLDSLILEAKRQSMVINISTNGLLLEQKAKMLLATGVDYITISVESHIPDIHDSIREYRGLLEKIRRGILLLKSSRKTKSPYISVRTVLHKMNYPHLLDHVQYWSDLVDDIMFKPIYNNKIHYTVPRDLAVLPDDEPRLRKCLLETVHRFPSFDNVYHKEIPNYFFYKQSLNRYPCFAGIFMADIDCEGNVFYCGEERVTLGNLTREKFKDIWISQKILKWRWMLRKHNRPCQCWSDSFVLHTFLAPLLNPVRWAKAFWVRKHETKKRTSI